MASLDFLKKQKVFVFDGSMGTMLQTIAMQEFLWSEEFVLINPDLVKNIHSAYINAGSDIIQTNTFGANSYRLKKFGLSNKSYEINSRAVELARSCAKDKVVAASVGPLGDLIEPYGNVSEGEAFEAYFEQAKGLSEVDFINIETIQSFKEAEIIISAFRANYKLPISLSATFQKTAKGYYTIMGHSVQEFVEKAIELDVDIIGTNCGEGFNQAYDIINEIKQLTNLPLLAKPNAGIPVIENDKIIYPETPDKILDVVEKFLLSGVKILGGCCGTTPEHIKSIKKIANKINFS